MLIKYNNNLIEFDFNISKKYITIFHNNKGELFELIDNGSKTELLMKNKSGKEIKVFFIKIKDIYFLQISGKQYQIQILDDDMKFLASDLSNDGKQIILPPMPGTILKINYKLGQKIREGDCILTIEAMKMETNLYSRIDGIITEINIEEGQKVSAEDVLAIIENE